MESGADRNFILQQGFPEPSSASCPFQYSALLFQPRVVGLVVLLGVILQEPVVFLALAAILWWSAAVPSLNPFDALYNWLRPQSWRCLTSAGPASPKIRARYGRDFRAGHRVLAADRLACRCDRPAGSLDHCARSSDLRRLLPRIFHLSPGSRPPELRHSHSSVGSWRLTCGRKI